MLYYSFSGQTSGILHCLANGLKDEGVAVVFEKLKPVAPPRFPVGSYLQTITMMVTTLFRVRIPIKKPDSRVADHYDLIILAGPTWSYNPSGPVLDFLAKYGPKFLGQQVVLPVISCRGYWRIHWFGLRKILVRCGALVPNVIVFSHPAREPWRTFGVFLKIVGKAPERHRFIGRFYKRFGHNREQMEEAERFGREIGVALKNATSLSEIDFRTTVALP